MYNGTLRQPVNQTLDVVLHVFKFMSLLQNAVYDQCISNTHNKQFGCIFCPSACIKLSAKSFVSAFSVPAVAKQYPELVLFHPMAFPNISQQTRSHSGVGLHESSAICKMSTALTTGSGATDLPTAGQGHLLSEQKISVLLSIL